MHKHVYKFYCLRLFVAVYIGRQQGSSLQHNTCMLLPSARMRSEGTVVGLSVSLSVDGKLRDRCTIGKIRHLVFL